ncbi:Uncharacterised protein [Mycobacteroides abscessus subsp. massiliense]|nr:Uncharacterised protein [Mycobacteroides abscessus subsp. massiliense]
MCGKEFGDVVGGGLFRGPAVQQAGGELGGLFVVAACEGFEANEIVVCRGVGMGVDRRAFVQVQHFVDGQVEDFGCRSVRVGAFRAVVEDFLGCRERHFRVRCAGHDGLPVDTMVGNPIGSVRVEVASPMVLIGSDGLHICTQQRVGGHRELTGPLQFECLNPQIASSPGW